VNRKRIDASLRATVKGLAWRTLPYQETKAATSGSVMASGGLPHQRRKYEAS
jgi:hypothetical protein